MRKGLYIFCLCLFPVLLLAQGRRGSENLLGAGGSNYSNLHTGRDGLITGHYSGDHHLIGGYLDGGYSTIVSSIRQTNGLPGGYAVGGGVLYQYQHNSFMVNVGVGVRWQDVKLGISDTTFTWRNVPDSWTNQRDTFHYDLTYSFYERVDVTRNVYVQVPILFGQSFGNQSGGAVYYLAGLKLNMQLKGSTSVKVTGTTTGEYDRYMGIFHEMDNHGLRKDVSMERTGEKFDLKLDVLASLEFGYEWASPAPKGYRTQTVEDWRLRLGVFVDFGLVNINPNTNKNFLSIPDGYRYDFSQYEFNHICSSNEAVGKSIHSVYCGIKLTALIGMKTKKVCRICGEYSTERDL